MEAVILIGVQAAGKTTFYRQRFFETHVRISLDMLRTREREGILIGACLTAKQPFVIDNTNILAIDRAPYIARARSAGFRVTGFYFRSEIRAAIARNQKRTDKKALVVPAILRSYKRLEPPSLREGFDKLYTVKPVEENQFTVTDWSEADSVEKP
jgi:predicted kinase